MSEDGRPYRFKAHFGSIVAKKRRSRKEDTKGRIGFRRGVRQAVRSGRVKV